MLSEKKKPVDVAGVAIMIAPLEEAVLPDGTIAPVHLLDGGGYQLWLNIEADPGEHGNRIWDLVRLCLKHDVDGRPITDDQIRSLNPVQCSVISEIAAGRIQQVQALAEVMSGNAEAPVTTAEPEPPRSSTLSDSSASASGESAAAT